MVVAPAPSPDRYWPSGLATARMRSASASAAECVPARSIRIGNEAAHHRDALDELGNALEEQQHEADEDQRLRRPLRQAAGIHRLLVELKRSEEKRHRCDDHDDRQRQQEEHMAEDIDAVAPSLRQHVVDDVDADVLVREKRPRRAQQEDRSEQDPLQLQPGIRRHVEDLAHRGVGGRNDHHDQDQPGQHLADPEIDRVDGAAQLEQSLHDRSPCGGPNAAQLSP